MRKWIPVTVAVTVAALVCVPLALGASSPTVAAEATTAVTDTSVTLNGTVDPNGAATTYQFAWGPTSALGNYAPASAASAGKGTTAVAEHAAIKGLTPGITYYFALEASNSSGTTTTPVGTFKTAGNPPPVPTTGVATGVGRYQATMTGTIAPNNQATSYYFQYGPTASYGLQTAAASVAAGTTTVAVSTTVPGLQPGATFHYRLVAIHTSTATTYGADETFETQPFPRPKTRFAFSVTPRKNSTRPFRFTERGRIGIPNGTPASLACGGNVKVTFKAGGRRVGGTTTAVQSDCQYAAVTRISGLPKRDVPRRGVWLTVTLQYEGDSYVAPSAVARTAVLVK